MTQLEILKMYIPEETNDELLLQLLDRAKTAINNRRYPVSTPPDTLEARYNNRQIEIAIELYNKQGTEGEQQHNESGTNRVYENAGISESLLADIVPKGCVL